MIHWDSRELVIDITIASPLDLNIRENITSLNLSVLLHLLFIYLFGNPFQLSLAEDF